MRNPPKFAFPRPDMLARIREWSGRWVKDGGGAGAEKTDGWIRDLRGEREEYSVTALDSNVLVDLLAGSAVVRERAERLVYRAAKQGPLVISPVVSAELGADPNQRPTSSITSCGRCAIGMEWMMRESVRRSAAEAGHLATRDREFYRAVFPEVVLIDAD